MSHHTTTVVEVQAKIVRGSARPEVFGWKLTLDPTDPSDQVTANVTEICRRLRDETQGKLK